MKLYCQSGAKWATNGNSAGTGDFIGTTNNQPLIFKTNNVTALQINPTGTIQISSVSNLSKGILSFDNTGKIIPFVFNNVNTSVLTGNGVWTPASLLSGWTIINNDVVQTATGNVGIGTTTPQTKLDVNGSVTIASDLKVAGNFQLTNFTGSGNRFIQTDANGTMLPFAMGNANEVLYGNGTWGTLPLAPASLWQPAINGLDIFNSTGNVGIGTNNPQYLLDVNGNVRIANNLYVGGGIIITDRVNAASEVNTENVRAGKMVEAQALRAEIMTADSIMLDSSKAIYGEANFKDNVKLLSKLDVLNDVTLQEKLEVVNDVTLQSKLDVVNDVKMQSKLEVIGNAVFNGNISATQVSANTINTANFNINTLLTANKISAYRITGQPGDSLIRFGDSTIYIDYYNNTIAVNSTSTSGNNKGLGIGTTANGLGIRSFAAGTSVTAGGFQSIVLGALATTVANAQNSVVIGCGVGTDLLTNDNDHSLMVGFNSNIPTFIVSKSPGINRIGKVGIGIKLPETSLHINGEGDQGITITSSSNTSKTRLLSVSSNNNRIETQLQYNGRFSFVQTDATAQPFKMIIDETGQVGIGKNPTAKLEIAHTDGAGVSGGMALTNLSAANKNSEIKFKKYDGTPLWAIGNDVTHNNLQDFFVYDNVANETRLLIDADGKVGVGCFPPANWTSAIHYKLYVEGGIATRDVKVTAGNFPDYVFESNYKLISIAELEKYISKNHHLPEIPSAGEIEKNQGFEIGDMQTRIVKKVEEQTLYIIDLQKQMDELKRLIPGPSPKEKEVQTNKNK